MPNETESGSQTPDNQNESTPAKLDSAELGNAINAAVSSHLRRFAEKQLPTLLAEAMKPFGEQIAALKSTPATPVEEKTKISPETAALTQQLEELKTRLAQEAEQRVAVEKKAREDRAFSEFKSHLSKSVRPEMLDMVARDMFHNQKLVDVAEDGSVTFRGTRSNYGITEEVAYPLKDGVENWLKSDGAKPFLPAPSTSNTPTTRKQVQAPFQFEKTVDPSKLSPEQRVAYAKELEAKWAASLASQGVKI